MGRNYEHAPYPPHLFFHAFNPLGILSGYWFIPWGLSIDDRSYPCWYIHSSRRGLEVWKISGLYLARTQPCPPPACRIRFALCSPVIFWFLLFIHCLVSRSLFYQFPALLCSFLFYGTLIFRGNPQNTRLFFKSYHAFGCRIFLYLICEVGLLAFFIDSPLAGSPVF